ncbi:MAG TPA: response regulator transcription factor, partial [Polyangiales bacterium]|nr:response regulator transcription factor [Polyangiales bacterium]
MADPEEKKPRVLVVEDELSIRRGLCDVLSFRGFSVEPIDDGARALELAAREPFDLILLDVMLPGLDGFSVCERLRARGDEVPIVMLTAKGSEEDILRGFELGADDYVTKPFSVRELLARVQAVRKRAARNGNSTEHFRAGPFEIEPTRSVARLGDDETALSAREVRILQLLSEDRGHIVSRRRLLREAWDMNNAEHVETRTVDMHIAKLRKKL